MVSWMLGGTMDQGGKDVSFEISSSYVILFGGEVGVTHGVLIYIITCNSFAIFLREFDMRGCRFKGKSMRVFNQQFAG